jgi:predicted O-methyltransferase YrrM
MAMPAERTTQRDHLMNTKLLAEKVKRHSISSARNLLLRLGLYARVRAWLARRYSAQTIPAQSPGTEFTHDYFSANIPQFERFLGDLKDRPCRLLEIGTWEGRSAIWMAQNIATHQSSSIETIDPYENLKLRHNLSAANGKVTFRLGPSAEVLRTLPLDAYDFIYIDGCHWTINVLEDAVLGFRLLKRGGIMAFDDYLWDDPDWNQEGRPREAVDAFLAIYAANIEVLHREDQVWLRKRRKLSS